MPTRCRVLRLQRFISRVQSSNKWAPALLKVSNLPNCQQVAILFKSLSSQWCKTTKCNPLFYKKRLIIHRKREWFKTTLNQERQHNSQYLPNSTTNNSTKRPSVSSNKITTSEKKTLALKPASRCKTLRCSARKKPLKTSTNKISSSKMHRRPQVKWATS